ncbi:MAG TPA: hypothetical protein VFZ00_34195, partial [Solirubrobacter sp.]|nr:hypothetical protein [Solirubrobacter sp.]
RATLRARRDDIRSALAAIADGIDATREQRDEAIERIADAAETTDTELVGAQLDAILPAFADGLRLDRATLEEWADFDERIGLVEERPDVDAAFDFTLAP